METSHNQTQRPQMPICTPYGLQALSDSPFGRLPQEIRFRIWDHLLPEAIIFQVSQRGRRLQWPRNPLTDLVVCFPQFQNELNFKMYSSTRFIFYDSLHPRNQSGRPYGYEIATKFFSSLGPTILSYIKTIYCHLRWTQSCVILPEFYKMLSVMVSADPPRNIKNLHLSFTDRNRVKPFEGAPVIRRQCFLLHGFPGLEMTLISPSIKDKISVSELNAGIAVYRDPGPPVNFLTLLPAELRNKIFRNLVPSVYSGGEYRNWSSPENSSKSPGWISVNRQMSAEICPLMYRECRFEFNLELQDPSFPWRNTSSRFVKYLKRIGRANARQIRSIILQRNYPSY